MVNQPLISVILPVYNGEKMVAYAIESVLQQTYENWELIIGNNASSDKTVEVLSIYEKLSKVTIIKYGKNLGLFGNLNFLLEVARGKYIMILCHDDYLEKEALKECLTLLEDFPECDLLLTHNNCIDESGNFLPLPSKYSQLFDSFKGEYKKFISEEALIALRDYGSIAGSLSGYFFKKNILNKAGFFNNSWRFAGDWEWIYRVAKSCNILLTKKNYVTVRLHKNQLSNEKNINQYLESITALKLLSVDPFLSSNSDPFWLEKNLSLFVFLSLKLFWAGRWKDALGLLSQIAKAGNIRISTFYAFKMLINKILNLEKSQV